MSETVQVTNKIKIGIIGGTGNNLNIYIFKVRKEISIVDYVLF